MNDIILKYLNKEASEEEIERLETWLEKEENQQVYKKWVRLHVRMNQYYLDVDKSAARSKIEKSLTGPATKAPKVISLWRHMNKVAAVLVLVLLGTFWYKFYKTNDQLVIPEDQIVLKAGSGEVYSLEDSVADSIFNAEGSLVAASKAGKLSYDPHGLSQANAANEEQLIRVPRGKRLQVDLADGSTVFMNADSELRFTSGLVTNGKRHVYLTGEAYFDVAHNENLPFVVHTGTMGVEVLGTEFDVRNYEGDALSEVVLVDGKVKVSHENIKDEGGSYELTPGMRAYVNKSVAQTEIVVDEIDVRPYQSWKSGEFIFRNTSFKDIIVVLGRTYNVEIELSDEQLGATRYNATIRSDDIYKTLDYFKYTLQIDYDITGNRIIFKNKTP